MRAILFALSQPALIMWLLKATALLLAALAATTMLRRASAGSRHLVWLATLVAILLLPALSLWTPVPLAILPDVSSNFVAATTSLTLSARDDGTPAPTSPASHVPSGATNSASPPSVGREQAARPLGGEPAFPRWRTLLVLWAGISFVFLGWLAFGALAVRRIVRRASPLDDGRWMAPLCEIADRLDLDAVPRLLASAQVEMPFACGILRPTVILPSSAEQWSDDRRRAVLFHELAHVRRRDLVGHTLGRIACAVYWFHPLVWTAARRLRAESERACDDLVLSCGARASDYADHLLDIVVGVRRHGAPATALPMARRRELEGRVLAILDPAIARVGPGRLQSVGMVAALGALALSVAAMAPARQAAMRPVITQLPNAPQLAERSANVEQLANGERSTRQPQLPAAAASEARVEMPAAPLVAPTSEPSEDGTPATPGSDSAKVALLTRVLRTDTDASVRRAAAWGLSDAHNHRAATDALLEALRRDDDDHVREMAAWALAGSSRDDVLRALAEAARRDASAEVRETSVWALATSDAREQIDALEKALSDESDAVRETAAWALGELPRRPASRALITALRDGAPEVRETAAWALAEIEDSGTASALAEAFMKETNAEVKMAELRALTMLGQEDQSVLESALTSKDAELRARAVRMLAGGGDGWPQPRPRPRPRPNP